MRIYLDDNRADKALAAMLKKVGHTVVRPMEANRDSASDARHLEYAITKDLVRYGNDPKKDMRPKHIVRAVRKLEKSGLPLVNQFVGLNQWR